MLDLIVPVYKSPELTKACLDSILAHLDEIAGQAPRLIVINDSPDDAAVSALLEDYRAHPACLLLANDTNQGFVKTANRGLALALEAGHDAVLINADTQTFPGTLSGLIEAANADPLIGFVSPRSNNASLCSLPHVLGGAPPSPEEAYRNWSSLARFLPKVHFAPTAVGFYLLIRHRVLADIGLLCEDFGLGYEEENELIQRANRVGYRAVLANHAFAYHAGSASFKLLDLALDRHRGDNLEKIMGRHPEFIALIQQYESSPLYRAEHQLSALVPPSSGRLRLAIDLTEMGCHHNGTNELALGVLNALYEMTDCPFDIHLICPASVFAFHGLRSRPGFRRADPENPGRYAVALRLGQPFEWSHISRLERLAPVNLYGMLDTIAADVGVIRLEHDPHPLWDHLARHANGFFFISEFSRRTFFNRYPLAASRLAYTRLLPTRLSVYRRDSASVETGRDHILVLGNHFPHKAAKVTSEAIRRAYPNLQVVVLGGENFESSNLIGRRSGLLDAEAVSDLFARASVVVLPSYIEGFGFGLLHALAAGKPVVARRIDAVLEILATFDRVEGVHLFDDNTQLAAALEAALRDGCSRVDDRRAIDWGEWSEGLMDFCRQALEDPALFALQEARIRELDLIRRAEDSVSHPGGGRVDVAELLSYRDAEFVQQAYRQILNRPPDPEGQAHFLRLLRRGVPRVLILMRLRLSPEGRRKAMRLGGLSSLVWPLVGKRR